MKPKPLLQRAAWAALENHYRSVEVSICESCLPVISDAANA
jgi:hypothetical protein